MRVPILAGIAVSTLFTPLAAGVAGAAPLPPFEPVDVCGTIVSRAWVPARRVPGVAGASGSLGRDREFPAHARVEIEPYRGIDGRTAARINALLGFAPAGAPGNRRLLLLLPTDDPALLDGRTSICVVGFRISGDEGGTWTSYARLVPDPVE